MSFDFLLDISQLSIKNRRDSARLRLALSRPCHSERRAKPAVEILRSKIAVGGISDGKVRLHFVPLRMTPSVFGGKYPLDKLLFVFPRSRREQKKHGEQLKSADKHVEYQHELRRY